MRKLVNKLNHLCMKKINTILYIILILSVVSVLNSCKKFEAESLTMTPIDVGTKTTYESLDENSILKIPIKFTSPCDSGIASASFVVINNRASNAHAVVQVQSPAVPIAFHDKTIDTTLSIPVRRGLQSVVIIVYDKAGRMSSQSVNVLNVAPSTTAALKTLTDVVISTDPADNENFFSLYEDTPVFGSADAMSKQARIDFMAVNMGGGKFISLNAYGAGSSYYNASKQVLAGFTLLSYSFLSSSKSYVNQSNFDAIKTEADLEKFLDDSVIAITPSGGANYNLLGADRRVSDKYGAGTSGKGFILGWGYRSHPTATAVLLNEAFALVMIKSVTKKDNGEYIITFDIKAPAIDERAAYSESVISPYDPYPL
jgi:hypothetical protein